MPLNAEQQELQEVQGKYRQVQATAQSKYHAVLVSDFSLGGEPVTSFVKSSNSGKAGAAIALCNRWIIEHAGNDSLWNKLYTEANGTKTIQIGVMRDIVDQFGQLAGHGNPQSIGHQGAANSELFLKKNGLIARASLGTGHRAPGHGNAVADPMLAQKIINDVSKLKAYGPGGKLYVTVYASGAGGHMICLYLGGPGGTASLRFSDIALFDPNLGEYRFENASDFEPFFNWVFQLLYNGYGSHQLRAFARKADSVLAAG